MSNITVEKDTQHQDGKIYHYPAAAINILEGAALMVVEGTGFAAQGADTANGHFIGIADKNCDNSAGSAGDKQVRVVRDGVHDFVFSGTATQGDVGKKVYLVDNQTVALAGTTTNDVLVGSIVEFLTATKVRVAITPQNS